MGSSPTSQSSGSLANMEFNLNLPRLSQIHPSAPTSYLYLLHVHEVLNELSPKEKSMCIEKHLKALTQKWREDYE
jgi:hypothetical protein